MDFNSVEHVLLENLRSLWRIKLALLVTHRDSPSLSIPVNYGGLPKHAPPNLFPRSETVRQASENLLRFSHTSLATTFLLANMAQYEAFLKHHIVLTKKSGPPGLGTLQKVAESNPNRPIDENTRILSDEIRERRNIVVHRAGLADERYTLSAAAAHPLSNGAVSVAAPSGLIEITPAYFTYATMVLIDYCRQVAGLNNA